MMRALVKSIARQMLWFMIVGFVVSFLIGLIFGVAWEVVH